MRLQDVLIIACVLPTQFLLLRTHDRLRMWEPGKRVAFGVAGIVVATALLVLGGRVIRVPVASDAPLLQDLFPVAFMGLIAVLAVLSVMQIGGGAVQGFQRRRHYRRMSVERR
jgi:hypothetical protein